MKQNHLIRTLSVLLIAACMAACGKQPEEITIPIDPGKPVDPIPTDSVTSDISSIYELNNGAILTNSHSDVWSNSVLEADYNSFVKVSDDVLSTYYAIYPRIKKMHNGQYLLLYQHGIYSSSIYYALSPDLKTWSDKGKIFEQKDKGSYKSADAIVLQNGDILALATCRGGNRNIMMRRSTDNGVTWGDETSIYEGDNWEPYALQLAPTTGASVGEIQVYFTCSDTARGDSGTALLRSLDNGATWDTTKGKIIRQQSGVNPNDNLPIYTDQMPVAIELNDGRGIAVALESRFGTDYNLSMAYSTDNWMSELADAGSAPMERNSNLFTNAAAPYLVQFPSGETVLAYAAAKTYYMRMGNSIARNFDKSTEVQVFPDKGGAWGSIGLDGSHTLVAVFPGGYDYKVTTDPDTGVSTTERGAYLQIGKFVLNHRINATGFAPTIDGSNADWKDVSDALFLGSDSPTQATFRFGYADDYLYVMVERSDDEVTATDTIDLMFEAGDATGTPFTLSLVPDMQSKSVKCNNSLVACRSVINSDPQAGRRLGYVVELGIHRSMLNVAKSQLLFNAVLHEGGTADTFMGLTANNYEDWLPIQLKTATKPDPEPEPGMNDNSGSGPGWGMGDITNPW